MAWASNIAVVLVCLGALPRRCRLPARSAATRRYVAAAPAIWGQACQWRGGWSRRGTCLAFPALAYVVEHKLHEVLFAMGDHPLHRGRDRWFPGPGRLARGAVTIKPGAAGRHHLPQPALGVLEVAVPHRRGRRCGLTVI